MSKISLNALIWVSILALCGGCYTPRQFLLQPGDKIIFATDARANEFRAQSLNDPAHRGRVVEITRPAWVSCE